MKHLEITINDLKNKLKNSEDKVLKLKMENT